MTTTSELPPFETRLLSELTDVIEERRRQPAPPELVAPRSSARGSSPRGSSARGSSASRPFASRRPVLAISAGIAATAVALAIVPGLTAGGGSPAFAVRELPGGLIEVDAAVDFRDGAAIAAELREYGVDVDLVMVPSSPSAVGAVHSMEAPEAGVEPGITYGDEFAGEGTVFTIDPDVFQGGLTLYLNVEAGRGETYVVREEVFEPGEVLGGLHCALGEPLRSAEVAPYLDEVGVSPLWQAAGPTEDAEPGVMFEEVSKERPEGEVLWGYALDDRTVELTVLPDGVELPAGFAPRLSDVPCTPEQEAAWRR